MPTDDLSDLSDQELLLARERVLEEFATALEILHIACGAPAKLTLYKQSKKDGRYTLPTSTLSEVFNGKRLPSFDFIMELIRQLRPGDASLQEEWRQHWMRAKYMVTRAAKAEKRLAKEAEEAQHRQADEIEHLREEAATELQRASLLRGEAEKALKEARAEAERIREQAHQEAKLRRQQPVNLSGPDLLRAFLSKEFRILTEPGMSATSARLRPELLPDDEAELVPPSDLAALWRVLHVLTLRLPQEHAAELRARWRAMALGIVGEVDGDGLVPGLPGVVEPLSFRDRATTMSSIAQRDHLRSLRNVGSVGEDVEIPGKLQYVVALMREYKEENRLLTRYDPRLVKVSDPSTYDAGPLRPPTLQVVDDGVQEPFKHGVDAQLAYLLGLLGDRAPAGPGLGPELIDVDRMLASLVPDPLPHRESWWFNRRRALQKKLASYLGSLELEVQTHDVLSAYVINELTDDNIELVDQSGNAVLWWLRLPYRARGGTDWTKGRMIHQSHIA
ncbi:ATP synthase F0 subunit B [Streptomyces sp. NPDC005728]|uniref:ATP synthase F0 subunit B n=1 Tax=Streptomyces sp. NPDC005728 TaxID=3157054 RepID=UPI0033ED00EC